MTALGHSTCTKTGILGVISRAAYEGGSAPFLTVLEAERARLDAEDQRAVARGDAAIAAITLYRAIGGGWSTPNPDSSQAARS